MLALKKNKFSFIYNEIWDVPVASHQTENIPCGKRIEVFRLKNNNHYKKIIRFRPQ